MKKIDYKWIEIEYISDLINKRFLEISENLSDNSELKRELDIISDRYFDNQKIRLDISNRYMNYIIDNSIS